MVIFYIIDHDGRESGIYLESLMKLQHDSVEKRLYSGSGCVMGYGLKVGP